MFKRKNKQTEYAYNPDNEIAAMRCSICTGERVAGFKNKSTGKFVGVTVIHSDKELEHFKKTYGVDKIEKIY